MMISLANAPQAAASVTPPLATPPASTPANTSAPSHEDTVSISAAGHQAAAQPSGDVDRDGDSH